eukprot:Hpha_TRINITY_DN14243_c0_g1::TRINITY_DN14243_c0_g1_i2::g.22628::m.22628/K06700/PSMF1; proteasome inhibitor subunit 1 (PI31)
MAEGQTVPPLDEVLKAAGANSELERTALACHHTAISQGFRTDADGAAPPEGWREGGDAFAFRYTHPKAEGSTTTVRVVGIAGKAVVILAREKEGSAPVIHQEQVDVGDLERVGAGNRVIIAGCLAKVVPEVTPPKPEPAAAAAPAPAREAPPPEVPSRPARPLPPQGNRDPLMIGDPRHPAPGLPGYGQADLYPAGLGGGFGGGFGDGGGMLAGPEIFHPHGGRGGGWGPRGDGFCFGPDGQVIPGPPPGARGGPPGPVFSGNDLNPGRIPHSLGGPPAGGPPDHMFM